MQPMIYEPGDIHSIHIREVRVDGVRVDGVVMADPHRGVVESLMFDKDGNARVDKRRKRILTKRLRGNVEVIFNEPA